MPGTNVPASAYAPAVGYLIYSPNTTVPGSGWGTSTAPLFDTVLMIGETPSTFNDFLWGAGMTAPSAYALDKKIDDGLPQGGTFQAMNAGLPGPDNSNLTCLTGTAYSISLTTGCTLFWDLKI